MPSASLHHSTQLARSILKAWSVGDDSLLRSELDGTDTCCLADQPSDSLEQERRELLDGVAAELRRNLGGKRQGCGDHADVQVCLDLLRHLTRGQP
jgi:hypothetical protein